MTNNIITNIGGTNIPPGRRTGMCMNYGIAQSFPTEYAAATTNMQLILINCVL